MLTSGVLTEPRAPRAHSKQRSPTQHCSPTVPCVRQPRGSPGPSEGPVPTLPTEGEAPPSLERHPACPRPAKTAGKSRLTNSLTSTKAAPS